MALHTCKHKTSAVYISIHEARRTFAETEDLTLNAAGCFVLSPLTYCGLYVELETILQSYSQDLPCPSFLLDPHPRHIYTATDMVSPTPTQTHPHFNRRESSCRHLLILLDQGSSHGI
jgi:hypothetical protein